MSECLERIFYNVYYVNLDTLRVLLWKNQLVMSSLSILLFEILLNIGPKWRPFWKPRWRPKTGRTNLLPSKFLYRKISTFCVPKFTILSRSAHFILYYDLRAPTIYGHASSIFTVVFLQNMIVPMRLEVLLASKALWTWSLKYMIIPYVFPINIKYCVCNLVKWQIRILSNLVTWARCGLTCYKRHSNISYEPLNL